MGLLLYERMWRRMKMIGKVMKTCSLSDRDESALLQGPEGGPV